MSILADILGTGKVIENGIKLIDDMHTSTEEEIKAKTRAKVDLIGAYHPFKRAQRLLMLIICVPYVLTYVVNQVMAQTGYGDPAALQQVTSEYHMGELSMIVAGFYFGGGLFNSVRGKNES